MVINLRRRSRIWRRRSLHARRDLKRAVNARCFLNGKEVTNDCFYYDGRRGIVRLYVRDDDGKLQLDRFKEDIVWREYRGRVKLICKKAAA